MYRASIKLLTTLVIIAGCNPSEEPLPELSGVSIRINQFSFVDFVSGRIEDTSWEQVVGGAGTIEFFNIQTNETSSFDIDGNRLMAGEYSFDLPSGNYNVSLDLSAESTASYLPFTAEATNLTVDGNVTLSLDADITHGVVLLYTDNVDPTFTPTLEVNEVKVDFEFSDDQNFYYLYVPAPNDATIELKEDVFDQVLSNEISILPKFIHSYKLVVSSSSSGVTIVFDEFSELENEWIINPLAESYDSLLLQCVSAEVTNLANSYPDGISLGDSVIFSVDIGLKNATLDELHDYEYCYGIDCEVKSWQLENPAGYTIAYEGGYSESGSITHVVIVEGGYDLSPNGDGTYDAYLERDNLIFYDGSNDIFELENFDGDFKRMVGSDLVTELIDLADQKFDLSFYWANWGTWGTYHYDFSTPQDSVLINAVFK